MASAAAPNALSNLYDGKEELPINDTSLTENVEYMKQWIVDRDTFFPYHFAEYYDLGELGMLQVIQDDNFSADITMNGIALRTGEFNGLFPIERSVSLTAEPIEDNSVAKVLGWKIYNVVTTDNDDADNDDTDNDDTDNDENPQPALFEAEEDSESYTFVEGKELTVTLASLSDNVKIQPLIDTQTGVSDVTVPSALEPATIIYDLYGHAYFPTEKLQPGIYIVRQADKTSKILIK